MKLNKRLAALESDRDNLMKRMSHQECPSPLMLDLVKRVRALDGGTDYEVHNVCKGCAKDFTCDQSRSKLCNIGGSGHPVCYREKHTCGECKKPYRKEDYEEFACFHHPGLAIGNYEKPSWRLPPSEACPAFEKIGEAP